MAGVLLLALLVGLRGMVPSGYMPDRSPEDGRIVMRLCGGLNERFVFFDPESGAMEDAGASGERPSAPPDRDAGTTCPFALTATFDVPKDEALLQAAYFGPPLLAAVPVLAAPPARPIRPPLPARGPPVRA